MLRENKNERGISFVEVMVTIAVLSFGIVLIYRSFFISLDYFNHIANRLYAMMVLDNKIVIAQRAFEASGEIPLDTQGQKEKATINGNEIEFYYTMTSKSVDDLEDIYQLDASFLWDETPRKPRISRSAYIINYDITD